MVKNKAVLVPAILCILAAVAFFYLKRMGHGSLETNRDEANRGGTPPPMAESHTLQASKTKREREDNADAKARQNMEKEFDELLPAKFPDQFSSICDVTLKPGESVILGGFKKADGNYEFTMITVAPNDSGESKRMLTTKSTIMVLSPERTSELGFDTLVSSAKTRIQKSIIIPTSGTITGAGGYVGIMAGPTMTAPANTPTTISMGNSESLHVISTLVNPQEDGDSIRLRTRIESPDGLP